MSRILLATFLLLVTVETSFAGMTLDHHHAMNAAFDPYYYLGLPNKTWVHIEVLSNENMRPTNASPPITKVKILKVLSGHYSGSNSIRLKWLPFPHDIDTGGREDDLRRWKQTPMKTKETGSKWIIAIEGDGEMMRVQPNMEYKSSDIQRVINELEKRKALPLSPTRGK